MSWRKITIADKEYEFKFGKSSAVIKDDNVKHIIDYRSLTGRSWETLERGYHKRTSDGAGSPRHIAKWIKTYLHGRQ